MKRIGGVVLTWKHKIPKDIAEKTVKLLHNITGKNVNVMGQGGEIIATIQKKRLGNIHEVASRIMRDEIIGCIGLTGTPEIVKPLQQIASKIIEEEILKRMEEERKQETINKVSAEIQWERIFCGSL